MNQHPSSRRAKPSLLLDRSERLARSARNLRASPARTGGRRVWLAPFMSAAGERAANDSTSERVDSWRSALAEAGVAAEPIMKDAAEFEDYAVVWADHPGEALAELEGGAA